MSDEKPEPIKRSRKIKRRFYDTWTQPSSLGAAGILAMENLGALAPDTGVLEFHPLEGGDFRIILSRPASCLTKR